MMEDDGGMGMDTDSHHVPTFVDCLFVVCLEWCFGFLLFLLFFSIGLDCIQGAKPHVVMGVNALILL